MNYRELVFDDCDEFDVMEVDRKKDKVTITIASKQQGSDCPVCGIRSSKIHSYYARSLMDLPMLGHECWIKLRAGKFYCYNDLCSGRVFTKRFRKQFKSGKRLTERVRDKVLKVALHMGGNGGEKICRLMNMPVSSSTLIRSIHQAPLPIITSPRVLGLDDWAYKKRTKYGTALIDLEKRKIIELLPDREVATVENWLKMHPQIEIVSRDRYVNYASGVTKALPNAVQVADRWHLIKNLGDSVKRVLTRVQGTLKQKAKIHYQQQPEKVIPKEQTVTSKSQIALARTQLRMDEVKKLFKQGVGIRAISRELQLSRATVRKYLHMDVALPKNPPVKNIIFIYEEYIREAIATRPGIRIKDLYHEIKALGYTGKLTTGYMNIRKYMPAKSGITYPKELPLQYWRPSDVSILLYRLSSELHSKERYLVNYLREESTEVNVCYLLFQKFRQLMREKDGKSLQQWLNEAIQSNIKELQSFAKGVLNDFSAVQMLFYFPRVMVRLKVKSTNLKL